MSDLLRFSSTAGSSTGASSEAGGIGGVSPGPAVPGVGREETQVQELVSGEDLLKEIEAVVERLKTIYSQTSKPLTDDTIEVSRFCRYLESILRHGQKEKLSFWGERRDYYHYIMENLSGLKNFEQIVKRVQGLSEIVSSQGKGRALVRLCLNEQLLADCVQTSISNVKKTKDWYQSGAVLLVPSLTERLISALYDLYDVTFSLPVDGLDLDDAWPSFIQKSFSEQSPRRTSNGGGGGGGGGVSGLLKKALVTREAKSIDKSMLYKEEYTLERAIEEEPSEIFVRHEVPFDLSLVGSLLEEIRTLLVDEFEGYSHMTNLPSIKVKQLDDISSGLSLLKDYVLTMSSDVTKSMDKRNRLVHQLKQQVFKIEEELKAEQRKAKDLEEEVQSKESDLASTSLQLQVTSDEKRKFWSQVVEQREQISALKEEIAQLKEDKSNMAATPPPSDTEMKQTIEELNETKLRLSSIESANSALSLQVEEERKSKEILENTIRTLKDSHESEMREASGKLSSNQEEIERLNNVLGLSQEELREKDSQLSLCRTEFSEKTRELEEELKALVATREELEKERDSAIEEVKSMQGLVEQETASLRFQLSTTNIQLQQNNESYSKREMQLSELKDQVQQLSDQLTQTRGSLYQKEEANEELRQQLAISDTRWQGLQEEMKSLNEQLTEKTLNRDAVREQFLKKEREWDDQRERMTKEMQRLSGFSTKMSQENEELRKAIQRLLAQKVSLWQHADELEQEQVAKGQWLDSRDVVNCMGCKIIFSMFNRKHHCRSCGKVFCGNCCSHKAQLPSNKDPVRVCAGCYGKIETLRTPQASSLVNPVDEESVSVKPALSNPDTIPSGDGDTTTNTINHINSFPGGVSLNSFLDGSDEPLLSHLRDGGQGSGTYNGKLFSSSQQSSMENSVEYCVEPLLQDDRVEGGDIGGKAITYTVSATDLTAASDPDDEFCVIETMSTKSDNVYPFGTPDSRLDVTALQAKLSKLETGQATPGGSRRDPSSSSTPQLSRFDDSERDGSGEASGKIPGTPGSVIREVNDMEVEGGKTHTVTVMVRTPRTVVLWQFNSQPKGIAVGLKYQESHETETQVEVLPLRRVMSHKTVLTGEYVAQKAGIYSLIFSNAHSKFSGRVLSYKVWTRAPS
ncbi:PREDICTED: FYVE and coiled-coil domain-containing protein 1-like [Amphimedon queenslandica]|uniref:FYVE-type domain-containing protein n=1 Tax=Amphimedon queenslandica TaxID=400682 RepID=A0A1X7UHN6_AMPQE|nr:PREDICTED: FYVE and coiled-coil domain-containing protein 1-like [Amphimedon queenslandica]|eukprot:XP_019854093.1 PREDICTED: FYVE and coiled-coil domain-containing protein 1-like [Amphimedon queenslandica]